MNAPETFEGAFAADVATDPALHRYLTATRTFPGGVTASFPRVIGVDYTTALALAPAECDRLTLHYLLKAVGRALLKSEAESAARDES